MNTNGLPDIGILADDLTSAADGAGAFVTNGWRAWIGRGAGELPGSQVVAIDCGSRSVLAAEAARRVSQATRLLASRHVLYKTVDSTLRGHVAAEIEACFHASGRRTLVFAPAFPAAGRTTVAGMQLVDGVPVSQSAYGRDPVHPARHSALVDLVPRSIARFVLMDATTQAELDERVAALHAPETMLWVGSPGMATALARRFAPAGGVGEHGAVGAAIRGDVLVVVGSANACSSRQADAVIERPGVVLLRSPRARQPNPAAVLDALLDKAIHALRTWPFAAVIATGGDTMDGLLERLGVRTIELLGELAPGFSLGRVTLDGDKTLLVAMKAGGFGDDASLQRATVLLRGAAQT
jgi:uncharacterized protein YgbK (DUF1537 family)